MSLVNAGTGSAADWESRMGVIIEERGGQFVNLSRQEGPASWLRPRFLGAVGLGAIERPGAEDALWVGASRGQETQNTKVEELYGVFESAAMPYFLQMLILSRNHGEVSCAYKSTSSLKGLIFSPSCSILLHPAP